jgi:hypothetical protein
MSSNVWTATAIGYTGAALVLLAALKRFKKIHQVPIAALIATLSGRYPHRGSAGLTERGNQNRKMSYYKTNTASIKRRSFAYF